MEVMKFEGGEPIRPLNKEEIQDALDTWLAEWVDAHPGCDSSDLTGAGQMICDISSGFVEQLDDLLEAARTPAEEES